MCKQPLILLGLPLATIACDRSATMPSDVLAIGDEAVVAEAASSVGLVRSTFPSAQDPGPPFYARIEPPPPHVDIVGGLAVIAFYRDPGCIRANFNLLVFFDAPAAFGCPLVVEGFALWDGEPFVGAPKIAQVAGTGAVPFWFIPAQGVLDAVQDGTLMIGELAAIPGRIVGHATHFNETQHPVAAPLPPPLGGGGHPNPVFTQNAQGTLEDGRSFEYHVTRIKAEVKTIRLRFI